MPYQVLRPPQTLALNIRSLHCHVRIWGNADAPAMVLLHGWMDSGASWQFLVDSLQHEWHVVAPDWRGFGDSQRASDGYWFPDYHADLDALLQEVLPDRAVTLVGHSMGGNIACIYAGLRPERVEKLVSLEGFGLPPADAEEAPARMVKWLDSLNTPPPWRSYASTEEYAERLIGINPRLERSKALFLAGEQLRKVDGRWEMKSDPHHKAVNPIPYRIEEARAAWRRVRAPTLWIQGDSSALLQRFHGEDDRDLADRAACFANIRRATIADAGHMLHQEQPAQVAAILESFLRS